MKYQLIFAAGLMLSGCGSPLEGTYSDAMGVTQYSFESNDKVYMTVMGVETELAYKVDGSKVKIIAPQGNMVFELNEDGSLKGPLGMKLTKKVEH